MKTMNYTKLILGLWLVSSAALSAADFSSGSNGSMGALDVTTNTTIDMPPDGIFQFTTIKVASGATLRFNKNALNTPVWLLATNDVLIEGTIEISGSHGEHNRSLNPTYVPGRGGPGGFDGGFGPVNELPQTDGQGPGGGLADGRAVGVAHAFSSRNGANTNTYGNVLLTPLVGGSGGAGWNHPGGGGAAQF